jgi:hypothetical protein
MMIASGRGLKLHGRQVIGYALPEHRFRAGIGTRAVLERGEDGFNIAFGWGSEQCGLSNSGMLLKSVLDWRTRIG